MEKTAASAAFRLIDKYPFLLLFLLFIGAFSTSCVVPLTGLFIVEGLGEAPWKMSIYACTQVTVTLLANRFYGGWIDRGLRLKLLPLVSSIAFVSAMALVASVQNFALFASVGALLLGISGASLSAMYSFGRLFAEQSGRDPARFNALLRMQTSLAWMIGPAVSLILYGEVGFARTFMIIGSAGLLWLITCALVIPAEFASHHRPKKENGRRVSFNSVLLLACVPVLLIGIGNVIFLSAAPLFFTRELGLPSATAGLALTVKCAIEVPAIYFCVHLTRHLGDRGALTLSALCAAIFFALIHNAASMEEVLVLAALDGFYYGIFAGVSMTYVQNAAPDRPGIATAYYVSTLFVGGLIGNFLTGTIASWQSFQATTLVSCGFAMLAFLGLLIAGLRRRQVPLREEI